ncbi:MAG: PEP-CTERM sorting domain-containing protein [Pseudomonadota bacterium]
MPMRKISRKHVFTALLALSVMVPFNSQILSGLGHGASALYAALRNPSALIAGRSPGSRGSDLIQSKPVKKVADAGPTERVLPEIRQRPAAGAIPVISIDAPALAGLAPGAFPEPFGPGGLSALSGGGTGPGFVGSVPTLADGGGGGGGVPPVAPPTSPVPEPATWMLMILGIFGVGVGLRRNQRQHLWRADARQ